MNHTLSVSLRPKSLDEVIGQQATVLAIRKKLEDQRLPVAWMFVGPAGTGKTTLALILARLLQGDGFGGEPEVLERNASDLNGVDDARELVAAAEFSPLVGLKRIVVMDESQGLTVPAQNVLLKALESETSPTTWVFCTTDPQKILKPLRDRCLTFHLQGLNKPDREKLVTRAFEAVQKTDGKSDILAALDEAQIDSPREVLQAVEKFVSGVPAADAVLSTETANADFFAIAKGAAAGNWDAVRGLLENVKNSDTLALRGVVAGYLGKVLTGSTGRRAEVYHKCLASAAKYSQGFQDGTTASFTRAWIYEICSIVKIAKEKTSDANNRDTKTS